MLVDFILLIIGIALVLWGADKFTDAASAVARRWSVSELVIGLTIVAMGTSLPELVVSCFSAVKGSADMSVGNVVGSNIFNTLVIVGASALMVPVVVSRSVRMREMPFSIVAAVVLWWLCMDKEISRLEAALLLVLFAIFIAYTFWVARKNRAADTEGTEDHTQMGWGMIALWLVVGIGCLVGGGNMLVDSAESIALSMGMSERLVGLTILAAGTSLPELATSVMAAQKGSEGLALGNALGSNLFNVFFVLGTSAMISPMHISGITLLDWRVVIGSGLLLMVFAKTGSRIGRVEGSLLVLAYIAYIVAAILQ